MALTDRRPSPQGLVTAAVVAVAVGFTLLSLQPSLLVADTVPAGGDMGAHVWGPAFLRDHLLAEGRLSGWAPDWYAGFPAYHFYMVLPSLLVVAVDVVLPYNVAFKLVSVSGLVALPVAAWALGRLARLSFPGPALLAVAAVAFVFDRSFTIYGGNAASTLAGEFAFSISLALALVFLGLVLRGLETGRSRALAAVVLALCALCHVIPALFAGVGALVALALRADRSRIRWLVPTAGAGGLLTAFWTVPFLARREYLNDMGWEKLTTYWEGLLPGQLGNTITRALGGQGNNGGLPEVAGDLTWVAVLAVVGVVTSLLFGNRLGRFLAVVAALFALAFVLAPQGRLWNARLLPFWYLCLYLLAAVALAEAARAVATLVARDPERPHAGVVMGFAGLTTVAVLVGLGLPLRSLPFGTTSADGTYRWAGLSTADRSFVPDWARWNYSGYQGKPDYPEFRSLLATMDDVGEREGCGRAMWEYGLDFLDRYGTPMAPMLLPYATDGCIASMEGLYFEASATTPFHFLNQAELSAAPSRAQRGLPYGPLDVGRGVDHLQLLGVSYYLAFSPTAVAAAEAEPDLTPVASSGPWRIFQVAGSELVEPLGAEPAVVDDQGRGWRETAVQWYSGPSSGQVLLAADGPASWARVEAGEQPPSQPLPPTRVTGIEAGVDSISFDVDRPGTPVLVKTSYFPNWQATGAEGPWRVTPNLMVVVPTDTSVELRYGSTPVEWLAWGLTLLGVVATVALAIRGRVPMAGRRQTGGPAGEEPVPAAADEPTLVTVGADGGADGAGNGAVPTGEPTRIFHGPSSPGAEGDGGDRRRRRPLDRCSPSRNATAPKR